MIREQYRVLDILIVLILCIICVYASIKMWKNYLKTKEIRVESRFETIDTWREENEIDSPIKYQLVFDKETGVEYYQVDGVICCPRYDENGEIVIYKIGENDKYK